MRQSAAQNPERPARGSQGACRPTTSRGANGGLLILNIDDGTKAGVFSSSATEERAQSVRRTTPRRPLPR
ncbi:uncharacterized protein CMC5_050750 [Chondromyces crocatus]|uniref:Uncharacterized protein n=1 Tax=Chondromyces crocatus TaxID=52 RepID=A0A0K1EJZ3_CHOCO|nr:uncharacterized protein CMC5_050750 [Chondromyces crocatus]